MGRHFVQDGENLGWRPLALVGLALVSLLWLSAAQALLVGIMTALLLGNPFAAKIKQLIPVLLGVAIVGLGCGLDLVKVFQVGLEGFSYTAVSLLATFFLGTLLGRLFNTTKNTSLLLTVGTGICGGSAIAAVAPIIRADANEIAVSLGIVFVLNALALFLFPIVGHHFQLTEGQFGLWSALAIHDTSSVVGACAHYGPTALAVGTTVKLTRALWIIPVAMAISALTHNHGTAKTKRVPLRLPWFIAGFLVASAITTLVPELKPASEMVELLSRRVMVVTLFLIGTNFTRATLSIVGLKPFVQGALIWIIMSALSLLVITKGSLGA